MHRTAIDQLEAAVSDLAGPGALKERIARAWEGHLESLDATQLPAPLRAGFGQVAALLHSAKALPGDTVVRASVRKLAEAEAADAASFLVRALRVACGARFEEAGEPAGAGAVYDRVAPLRLAGTG